MESINHHNKPPSLNDKQKHSAMTEYGFDLKVLSNSHIIMSYSYFDFS
jgi:hypothetical protein